MIDELTIYNLSIKYPNTVDLVREVEKMVRADAIEEFKEYASCIVPTYEYDNLSAEQKQEFVEYMKRQIRKCIDAIAEQLKEQK